jgi:hypothetical protein
VRSCSRVSRRPGIQKKLGDKQLAVIAVAGLHRSDARR